MLLWRDMYPKRDIPKDMDYTPEIVKDKPWLAWGRPQGGFLDLGCVSRRTIPQAALAADSFVAQGNGLLVHILISEASL